jgi:hypothetical protein
MACRSEERIGGRDQRAGGVPGRRGGVEGVPVQVGVQAVIDAGLDRVRLTHQLFLAGRAEDLDGGLVAVCRDGLADGDRGGHRGGALGVVSVAVTGPDCRPVCVVVVDEGVMLAGAAFLGQPWQRVVLGVEAEDRAAGAVGGDEGRR